MPFLECFGPFFHGHHDDFFTSFIDGSEGNDDTDDTAVTAVTDDPDTGPPDLFGDYHPVYPKLMLNPLTHADNLYRAWQAARNDTGLAYSHDYWNCMLGIGPKEHQLAGPEVDPAGDDNANVISGDHHDHNHHHHKHTHGDGKTAEDDDDKTADKNQELACSATGMDAAINRIRGMRLAEGRRAMMVDANPTGDGDVKEIWEAFKINPKFSVPISAIEPLNLES